MENKEKVENDFIKAYWEQKATLETRALANRETVFAKLKELGINEVVVRYQGSGDSGDFERPYDRNADAGKDPWIPDEDYKKTPFYTEQVTITAVSDIFDKETGTWVARNKEVKATLGDAIQDIAYGLLEAKHPGWEINEGSDGEFIINVEKEIIELGHNNYETVSHSYNYGWEKDDK